MSSTTPSTSPTTAGTATRTTTTPAARTSRRASLTSRSRPSPSSTASRRSMLARRGMRTWVRRLDHYSVASTRVWLNEGGRLCGGAIHGACEGSPDDERAAEHVQAVLWPLPTGPADRGQEAWCWRAAVSYSMCVIRWCITAGSGHV